MLATSHLATSIGGWSLLLLVAATSQLLPAQAQEENQSSRQSPAGATANSSPAARKSDQPDQPLEAGKYYVTGRVFDEESNEPVADAALLFLVDAETDRDKRLRRVTTDVNGRFRFETPIGGVRLWFPELKPGYWIAAENDQMSVVTTAENPVSTLEIPVKRGNAWPAQIVVEGGIPEESRVFVSVTEMEDDAIRKKMVNGENWSLMKAANRSSSTFSSDGNGAFTECGPSGKLWLSIRVIPDSAARAKNPYLGADIQPVSVEMLVDSKFDVTNVQSARPIDKTDMVELVDRNGARATIGKAHVTLTEGRPLLTFHLQRNSVVFLQQDYFGRVIDQSGNPIADVEVGTAVGIVKGGSAEFEAKTKTDRDGRYQLQIRLPESKEKLEIRFIFTKVGYAGADSKDFPIPKNPGSAIDVGDFNLKPGRSIPVRVTDANDQPLAGAVVEPVKSYASRRSAIRTDQNGRGELRDLPEGIISLMISHGSQYLHPKVVISPVDGDNTERTFVLKAVEKSPDPPAVSRGRKDPITVGTVAPELSIQRWVDGKEHKLSDYHGRVVVLDFWGVWCGGGVTAIPTMRDLATKYQSQNVEFLAIHTPDGNLDEINKLRKIHEWTTITGIESGHEIGDGATSTSYGVQGYPTIIVIDAEGRIAFNSSVRPKEADAFMKEMQQLAESLKISLPSSETSEKEAISFMHQIMTAKLSREIDKAIAAGKQ